MKTSEIVRKLCSENNKSVTKVEEDLKFGNGSLTKDGYLRSDRLYSLAQYFGVSMEYLMTGSEYSQSSTPSPFLPSDEEALLADFRNLNKQGKEKAAEYISDLAGNEKYIKDTPGMSMNVG